MSGTERWVRRGLVPRECSWVLRVLLAEKKERTYISTHVRQEVEGWEHESAHRVSKESWTSRETSRRLFLDPTLGATDLESMRHPARHLRGWTAPANVDVADRTILQRRWRSLLHQLRCRQRWLPHVSFVPLHCILQEVG